MSETNQILLERYERSWKLRSPFIPQSRGDPGEHPDLDYEKLDLIAARLIERLAGPDSVRKWFDSVGEANHVARRCLDLGKSTYLHKHGDMWYVWVTGASA